MNAAKAADDIAKLSFEAALGELEAIVQRLERGQLDLEASIEAYERGTALRRHCATKLDEARLRVERITFDKNGKPGLEPVDDT
jgi:exodeoxyribonuclease VII small subunit